MGHETKVIGAEQPHKWWPTLRRVAAAAQSSLFAKEAAAPGATLQVDAAIEHAMSLYSLRERFFSQSEGAFYWALRKAVSNRYLIFAKVRLLDICDEIPNRDWNAMNRISAKHVDFLLCEPATFEPVVAIEVDGSSHQWPDRIERDAFVNELFERIGLPLVRVAARRWFESADVLKLIEDATSAD
jgi:hypothetical protein